MPTAGGPPVPGAAGRAGHGQGRQPGDRGPGRPVWVFPAGPHGLFRGLCGPGPSPTGSGGNPAYAPISGQRAQGAMRHGAPAGALYPAFAGATPPGARSLSPFPGATLAHGCNQPSARRRYPKPNPAGAFALCGPIHQPGGGPSPSPHRRQPGPGRSLSDGPKPGGPGGGSTLGGL